MEPAGIRELHPWRAAVAIGLLVVAAGMVYSIALAPWVRGDPDWWLPPDAWINLAASHSVANHGLGHVYRSSPLFVATPLFPILMVPVAIIGSHWHLSESFPTPLGHPSMWLLYGPVMMATGILVLHGARRLLTVAGVRSRLGRVQWALVPLTLFPIVVTYGHIEDALTLALVLWGVGAHLRRRPVAAALLFGAAIASKQWALLGFPVLLATSARESRRRVVMAALGVPAAVVLLPLIIDWSHAGKALLGARAFVQVGHRALWTTASETTIVGTPFRFGALLFASVAAWRLRGDQPARRLLAGYAVAFAGRILFEPVTFSYYLGPGLAFFLLYERVSAGTVWRTVVVGTGLLVYFEWFPDPVLWWLGAWALLFVLSASAVAEVFGVGRSASGGGGMIPITAQASWPRSSGGSRWSPRRGASRERPDTTSPARARS
jgi:hypothetical protein